MKKNRNSKKAKFFCEFCGAEVKQNDKVCTYCGKFFSSVRCPNCGKTGRTDEFTNGCPECGYAVTPGYSGTSKKNNKKIFNGLIPNKKSSYISNKKSKKNQNYDGSLPGWIYIIAIAVLIIVIISFYGCLNK